jgi:hypothetical protein
VNTTTTRRPMHISTTWLAVVLIAALAVIAIELGIDGVHVSPLQPMPAQAQPAQTHATMSGDFRWLMIVA